MIKTERLKVIRWLRQKRLIKEVQPDVTAQIFWLKNRMPEQWRDTKVLQGNQDKPLVGEMPKMTVLIESHKKED